MKKLLFLFLLINSHKYVGQTYVLIPDPNFATCLQTVVPAAMSGNSLNTTHTLVTTTQTIDVSFKNISNLTGIQYFSSLTYLNCLGNLLVSMPTLPNSIQTLNCMANDIASFPNLPTSLVNLYCGGNELTSLPSLPNSLQALTCSYNLIKCFPVFPQSITSINISNNPFDCLPNHISAMSSSLQSMPLCSIGNTNGCPVASSISKVQTTDLNITVYPNPTSGYFAIETSANAIYYVNIFDLSGRLVYNKNILGTESIDLSNLNDGVYNLAISNVDGQITKKLVVIK